MKLTGAAILVSRGMKVLQAAPAAYPYRSPALFLMLLCRPLMSNDVLIANLLNAVERLNAAGDSWGWPGAEIAHVAIRRWDSYARRHRKAKRVTDDERVLDLAKGLQAHFEPDIPYTHPSDWRALAVALAEQLNVRSE